MLLSAFRQDVTVHPVCDAGPTLLDYCRRSANPVGRLVLRIAGYRDERLDRLVGRHLHRAAADQLLAGPAESISSAAASTCPRDEHAGARRAGRGSRRRTGMTPRLAARSLADLRVARRARCSTRAGRSAMRFAAGCATSCARPGSAACASSIGSTPPDSTSLRRRPTLGSADTSWFAWPHGRLALRAGRARSSAPDAGT